MLEIVSGNHQLNHYKELLLNLGKPEDNESDGAASDHGGESEPGNAASDGQEEDAEDNADEYADENEIAPIVKEIYANASSFIKKLVTLNKLVSEIEKLDWYSAREERLGDLYEGLLQKNAEEKKSGAGQYFTPRPLIDCMVAVMQPTLEDVIQDPAAGTGGFPIAALHWIRDHYDISGLDEKQQKKFYEGTFYGMEHVQDTHRLALMNLMLHGLDSRPGQCGIWYGDTLSSDGLALPLASLILTNPPFGTKKGGGLPSRDDFTFPTSNKQFCFLQPLQSPAAGRPGGGGAARQRAVRRIVPPL